MARARMLLRLASVGSAEFTIQGRFYRESGFGLRASAERGATKPNKKPPAEAGGSLGEGAGREPVVQAYFCTG